MALGAFYICMMQVLYATPMAMVLTGRTCSSLFYIARSSRQGCPLSLFLFALSLEPLAQTICTDNYTMWDQPSQFFVCRRCPSYLGNLLQSILYIISIFGSFSGISGYKINWSKSAILHSQILLDHGSPLSKWMCSSELTLWALCCPVSIFGIGYRA